MAVVVVQARHATSTALLMWTCKGCGDFIFWVSARVMPRERLPFGIDGLWFHGLRDQRGRRPEMCEWDMQSMVASPPWSTRPA